MGGATVVKGTSVMADDQNAPKMDNVLDNNLDNKMDNNLDNDRDVKIG